jgi:hypothetical protein
MKPLYTLALLAISAAGCTFTSGTLATGESPYIDVAAGAEVYISGPSEDAAATFDLKLGYRWPKIAVDAALMWTRAMNWTASHCIPEDQCISNDTRDLVGIRGAMQVYFLDYRSWIQPYIIFGLGIRAMHYHEVVWASMLFAGGGVEISLVGGLSLNVGVMYALTRFEHGIGSTEGRSNHAFMPMGGLRFYF